METNNKGEFKEVVRELIGWDQRIIRTLRDLATNPGLAVKGSLSEPTKYISPWVYFFSIEALGFYLMSFGFYQFSIKGTTQSFAQLYKLLELDWDPNGQLLPFLMSETGYKLFIPFVMIFRWLCFRPFNPSFKSNCFFLLYMAATLDLAALVPILFWYLDPGSQFALLSFLVSLLLLAYFLWATVQFYDISWGTAILRTLMLYAVAFVFKIGVLVVAGILVH